MNVSNFIKDYLTFTRKERIGIITLVGIIMVVFILPDLFSASDNQELISSDTTWVSIMQKLEQKQNADANYKHDTGNEEDLDHQYQRSTRSYFNKSKGTLFYFDPNTLSLEGWQKLGLRDRTIQTIQNYLKNGGQFKVVGDLQKIYGLHTNEYERIQTFVRIKSVSGRFEKLPAKQNEIFDPGPRNKVARYNIIEINSADTNAFISLPGIGSKLASRIVSFRDKLGGFYSIEQIRETYGLPDSTFQKIKSFLKVSDVPVKKFDINTATKDEMKRHPYIKWNIANAIVEYRNQHGDFQSLEDLKKIALITDDVFNKISPYLGI